MDLAGTLINAFVVLGVGAFLTYVVADRFNKLEGKFEARFEAVDGRFEAVHGRFESIDGRFEAVETRLAHIEAILATKADKEQLVRLEERMDLGFNALRADLTQVALAVGAQPRAAEG